MIFVSVVLLSVLAGCGQIGHLTYIDLTESTPQLGWSDTSSAVQADAAQQLELLQDRLKLLNLNFETVKAAYESSHAQLEKSIDTLTDRLAQYKAQLKEQEKLLSDISQSDDSMKDDYCQSVQQAVAVLHNAVEQVTADLNATNALKEKIEQDYLAQRDAYEKERIQLETLIVSFPKK